MIEAMAAGLPVVSTDVGDVSAMVAPENQPLIVPVSDEPAFTAALGTLVQDGSKRQRIGTANRNTARRDYDEAAMISRYARLYGIGV